MKKLIITLSIITSSLTSVFANTSEATSNRWLDLPFEILAPSALGLLILLVLIILLVGITIETAKLFRAYFKEKGIEMPWILSLFGIFDGDTSALTGTATDAVIEDHDYDGIVEFDNDLPPWWKYLFYITIVFGVVYMLHYHVFNTGDLMEDEYNKEVAMASILYANVDLEYDAPSEDKELLKNAQVLYIDNCAACHGQEGQGGVGPNLTDEYWIHGGDVNDLYKTVKYGVIEKGMKDWQSEFNNQQIYEISSYILSLQGTNPPNAKEPQGEKMTNE